MQIHSDLQKLIEHLEARGLIVDSLLMDHLRTINFKLNKNNEESEKEPKSSLQ